MCLTTRFTRHACGLICGLSIVAGVLAQGEFSDQGAMKYVSSKDWDGLIGYATNWTKANPQSAKAWYYLGTAYFTAGKPDAAVGPLQRSTTLDPRFTTAWVGLGFANDKSGHFPEAAAAFQRALELAPTQTNYWNTVTAYLNANQRQQALAVLQKQRSAAGTSATANDWHNIGLGFDAVGRPADAKSAYQQALRLNPDLGPTWNNLGVIEQNAGNADEALKAYQRAASLGEQLGVSNEQNLRAGLAVAAQHAGGSRQITPQMMREFVRQGQAKAWKTNNPGSLRNPYGRP
jgi:tetratricopeptide (TPR) repeat protein